MAKRRMNAIHQNNNISKSPKRRKWIHNNGTSLKRMNDPNDHRSERIFTMNPSLLCSAYCSTTTSSSTISQSNITTNTSSSSSKNLPLKSFLNGNIFLKQQLIIIIINIIIIGLSSTLVTGAITYDELLFHQKQQQLQQLQHHQGQTFQQDQAPDGATVVDLNNPSLSQHHHHHQADQQQSPTTALKRYGTSPSSSSQSSYHHHSPMTMTMMTMNDEPEFVGHLSNITVSVGRDAKFPCIVNNLDTYRVGWIRNEDKAILTIQHQVVTRNSRISLTQSDHKIWTLHIKNVQESDRGGYMCQINTMPMKSQIGYLDVTVPPDFINSETSSDVMVRENQNLTLRCKARGHPEPKLTWRREDNKPIEYGNWQQQKEIGHEYPTSLDGETITINKVSRLHMGAYLCIAQNGVPPSVSRRIVLQVNFPPMIWVPNQLMGASIGDELTLECDTEAFPLSLNYWTKEEMSNRHQQPPPSSSSSQTIRTAASISANANHNTDDEIMIVNSDKYRMSHTENSYKVHMKLIIKKITADDFGTYRCHAKNSLGSTQGSIRIYEIHRTVSSSKQQHHQQQKEPSTARIQSQNDSSKDNGDDDEDVNGNGMNGGRRSPNEEYYSANANRPLASMMIILVSLSMFIFLNLW